MVRTGDHNFIKELNKSIVLNLIRSHGPISRAQIANQTGLNKATVSSLVEELIGEHLISEVGPGHSRVGRRPVILLFNGKAGYTVGVDLGVDYIRVILTDLSAEVAATKQASLPSEKNTDEIINLIVSLVQEVMKDAPASPLGIIGVGVGVPGLVDFARGIVLNAPNLGWQDVHLKALLESALGLHVLVDNEANAGALGEKMFGAGKDVPDLIYLSVGTGIGTGLVLNNELWRGKRGIAGEFGHMTIECDGLKCSCGNYGCLEMYASEKAILAYYEKAVRQKVNFEQFLDKLKDKDPESIRSVQAAAQYLGVGISNLFNGLSPSLILIGNRVAETGEWLIRPIEQTVQSRCVARSYAPLQIRVSSLGKYSCAIGACALVLHKFFSGPMTKQS